MAAKTDSGGWRTVMGIPQNAVRRKHYSQTAGRRSQSAGGPPDRFRRGRPERRPATR